MYQTVRIKLELAAFRSLTAELVAHGLSEFRAKVWAREAVARHRRASRVNVAGRIRAFNASSVLSKEAAAHYAHLEGLGCDPRQWH